MSILSKADFAPDFERETLMQGLTGSYSTKLVLTVMKMDLVSEASFLIKLLTKKFLILDQVCSWVSAPLNFSFNLRKSSPSTASLMPLAINPRDSVDLLEHTFGKGGV